MTFSWLSAAILGRASPPGRARAAGIIHGAVAGPSEELRGANLGLERKRAAGDDPGQAGAEIAEARR